MLEIFPASSSEKSIRVEFFGDEIDRISEVDALTGKVLRLLTHAYITPASHYATTKTKVEKAIVTIEEELEERLKVLKDQDKLLEAQRLEQRTRYDLEMLEEMGYCNGIENYSRHLSQRPAGSRPYTLIDYFPDDFITIIDESHQSIPQIRGMFNGDRSRKETLVEYGFRLPSALDNRPLRFFEFESMMKQCIYVSATPGPYEREHEENSAEQIIRPTGLLDPQIFVRPVKNQIDDLVSEINKTVEKKERVLVTTLTKRMAEDLTKHFKEIGIKATYMHSDVETLERMQIIKDLRQAKIDVLVGINLLREGLDMPEVSLVAILDADKEGFLRSRTSLIQTAGRAARNVSGKVIMYADNITESMKETIDETNRRRKIQDAYNKEHGIVPKSIIKDIRDVLNTTLAAESDVSYKEEDFEDEFTKDEIQAMIDALKPQMYEAAEALDFEKAAEIRDKIKELKEKKKEALV